MNKKIKLSYINKGKSFSMPKMTVGLNEKYLEYLAEMEKKYDDEEKINREANKLFMLEVLKQIDDSVTMETILNMHPNDFLYLFNTIWQTGVEIKEEGDDKNF